MTPAVQIGYHWPNLYIFAQKVSISHETKRENCHRYWGVTWYW